MNHRIAAGMICLDTENRVLMVRHRVEGQYDFWVVPGGGVKGTETLEQAAVREVREETGLHASATKLLYVEEMFNPETRHCKFWFVGKAQPGVIDVSHPEARDEYIVEAAWLSEKELKERLVFPEFLREKFWRDLESGKQELTHMGLREMEFW